MTPEVLKRCFTPFFTTKGEQGTGLGLASVHAAALEHAGAVTVASEPGRGSAFTLWLPVLEPRARPG
jgi:signal transduction histidine kinase